MRLGDYNPLLAEFLVFASVMLTAVTCQSQLPVADVFLTVLLMIELAAVTEPAGEFFFCLDNELLV